MNHCVVASGQYFVCTLCQLRLETEQAFLFVACNDNTSGLSEVERSFPTSRR